METHNQMTIINFLKPKIHLIYTVQYIHFPKYMSIPLAGVAAHIIVIQ